MGKSHADCHTCRGLQRGETRSFNTQFSNHDESQYKIQQDAYETFEKRLHADRHMAFPHIYRSIQNLSVIFSVSISISRPILSLVILA